MKNKTPKMTKEELKHAVVSLVLGVLSMAISSFVLGGLDIFKHWMSELIGGGVTTIKYLSTRNQV